MGKVHIHIHSKDGEGLTPKDDANIAKANELIQQINSRKIDPLSTRSNTYRQLVELSDLCKKTLRIADPIEWK